MTNYLTKKEHEIMEVLWDSEKPMLISEILVKTQNKKIADNSVLPMIRKLIDRGYIKVVGNIQVAKTQSRFYAPSMTIDEYAAKQLQDLFKASNKQLNVGTFLSFFTKNKGADDKVITEIEEFIDNFKKNKNN